MIKQAKFKRKQYFLKGTSQLALIFKVYGILLTVMFLSGAIFYFIGNHNLTQEFFKAHSVIKSTMQLLLPALVLVGIIGLFAAFFMVVTFTHSIAGPIHRFKNLSERIVEGDLTVALKFRNKDTIHELSGIINKIIRNLNSRLKQFQGPLSQLQKLSLEIHDLGKFSPEDLHNFKNSLLSVSSSLEREMEKFKL